MSQPSYPAEKPPAPVDNFHSPANYDFYTRQPYEPLDKVNRTICLLVFKKDASGELQCKLRDSVPLAEADDTYTAISYCAGDPKKTQTIIVNGLMFNAFANLALAIENTYNYRFQEYGDVEAILWTGQICINQSDPVERSHQVGLMYQIYSSAREVVVCLSTGENRGVSALAWLRELCRLFPQIVDPKMAERNTDTDPLRNERSRKDELTAFTRYLESNLQDATDWSSWHDLLDMLQQPWWSRAWVVQEYVAARRAVFLYGGENISKVTMIGPLQWFLDTRVETLRIIEDCRFAMQFRSDPKHSELYDLSNRWHRVWLSYRRSILDLVLGPHDGDLLQLLSHSRNCSASDKRDHVYAFLGLENNAYNIHIDYGMTNNAESLFLHSAQQIVERSKDLRILQFVDDSTSTLCLPSWVPDWSSRDSGNRILIWNDQAAPKLSPWPFPPDIDINFLDNRRALEISGVYLDTFETSNPNHWTTTKNNKLDICTALKEGADKHDQFWMLYGARPFAVLRPHGEHFRFRTEAHFDKWGKPYWPKEELDMLMRTRKAQRIRLV